MSPGSSSRPVRRRRDASCRPRPSGSSTPDGPGRRPVGSHPAAAWWCRDPPASPPTPLGLVLNVTSVEATEDGFLNISPTNGAVTPTSFMNPDGSGDPLAAFVIAPLTADGLTIRATTGGHVIVDLIGWFTGPSAASSSDGLFVPTTPTRRLDTRDDPRNVGPVGAIEVAGVELGAGRRRRRRDQRDARPHQRRRLRHGLPRRHATARRVGRERDTTRRHDRQRRDHAAVDAWHGVLLGPRDRRHRRRHRVLHGLAGRRHAAGAAAQQRPVPCVAGRRLHVARRRELPHLARPPGLRRRSTRRHRVARSACRRVASNPVPNSVATINAVNGRVDAVVIMAGYDEWWTTFPDSFEAVNDAARAKGARRHHLAQLPRGRRIQDARRHQRQRGVREEQPDAARQGRVRRQSRRRARRLVRLHVGDSDVAQSGRDPPHVHGRVRRRRLHLAHDRQHRGPAVPTAVGRRWPGRRTLPRP